MKAMDELSQGLIEWVVSNGQCNDFHDSLCLSGYSKLKRIVIGDDCFGKVRLFELNGLNELESIVIGQRSLTYAKMNEDIENSERKDGTCRIVNCPKLKSIQIDSYSFGDYHSFELSNLPSLQSVDISGEWCFYWTSFFSLSGLVN